uniref:Uncharacterized protein n=1 Tax=Photinus pyralis TaxID=7054 RepID=A0A1Y1MDP2_PHOPY
MRVATNKLVTRVVNKSESPIQVGRPTNGSSSESDLELEENTSKVRGSLESSECADGVESLRSSEADSLEYCTKNVEWEDTDAVYFRDNSLVETAQKLWREEKCTDLDIEPKGPKSSSSSSDRSTFKEVLSAHPLDQIHSESDLSVCNISSEDSGGETLSLKLANDDTREYAHPPCESLKEKWPTFESELSNPDHSCKATTELSVDREGNTSDYIPKKRRKFNDNLTTIVPTHYDSYRLNLGESAIYSSRSEKATKRLSPRLLALINVITNAPGDNSNRSATDQLLTISIGDCRRLLELDPNAVPVGDMLSKMNLTRSSASEEAELLKTKLPLISKVPVQKVSYDKNVSSRSSIVSLPQIVPKR